ncbi:MAG TPA: HAMP domain-containing sensor histidine kinase, partial [Woeseiaceae bacterium]|nr:HAMP domain-containing sensor histidine kinase [Woeseiaceae bacterium]
VVWQVAEQRREAWQQFDPRAVHIEASQVLSGGGPAALREWVADGAGLPPELRLYVLLADGRDILGRPLPEVLVAELARLRAVAEELSRPRALPPNFRPARPIPQILGPEGTVYSLFLFRRPGAAARLLPGVPVRMTLLLFALAVSAGVAWLLARTLSRPVTSLRDATRALADGNLDTRVRHPIVKRRDELGGLARDFNEMAAQLEASLRSQRELLRNVSHELRSPLARMRVALGLAQRDAGELAALARIERESDRLDWLIGEIMDFARADSGRGPRSEEFDLTAMLRELVRDARFESGDDGPRIELEAPAGILVRAQRSGLASAVENVLRNAAHHAERRVDVRVSREAGGLAITVADDGGGVPAEELGLLFEPFYRGDKVGTAGLGLAIARRVTELHGGTISARNGEHRGLQVTITLPGTLLGSQRPS